MELVYLWIKKYKNIDSQGFNFSPRFEFDYDEKTSKLTKVRDDSKTYKSIFSDKINITAIVGENGSGKSSILKSILQIKDFPNDYIVVYKENDTIFYNSNIEKNINIINADVTKDVNNDLLRNTISYDKFSHIMDSYRYYKTINISMQSIINILVSNQVKERNFKISSFMYIPTTIKITYKEPEKLINQFISLCNSLIQKELVDYFLSIDEDRFHQFLIIEYIRNNNQTKDIGICKNLDKLKKYFENELPSFLKKFIKFNVEKIFNFLEEKEKIEYYTNEVYFDYFEYELIDDKDNCYDDLTHGEKNIFGQLLNIYLYTERDDNLLFLFDEPEIALHPQWQKKYLMEVIQLLKKMDKKYHFIFTSHSPFLLSDLPKENIIFLKKDKKTGECLNVTKETELNPFGANIHTLLSDGFFMSDGLMGEFAKGEIEDIKKFYEKVKKSRNPTRSYLKRYKENIINFKYIQSIIGEPFLQTIIKNYLDELELIFSSDKTLINKRLEELDKEKRYLESLRND